jgi:hypothetical protein
MEIRMGPAAAFGNAPIVPIDRGGAYGMRRVSKLSLRTTN